MRIPTILLAVVVTLLATPVTSAQTPAATTAPGTLLEVIVDELPADLIVTTGMIRTTYPAGSSLQLGTGSGPSLHYIETGSLTVVTAGGEPPIVLQAASASGAESPQATIPGDEVIVAAGVSLLLAAGSTAEVRNDGAEPAIVLDLLAAPDATPEMGEGITQAVLVRQEVALPEPPVSITLSRDTIESGESVTFADEPALTFFAPVDRSQAFSLSAQGSNRFADPVDVFVLVIGPV